MPSLKTHLMLGVFTYPIYLFGYSLVLQRLQLDFVPEIDLITVGYLIFIVGSDLPDIDHKDAPIQHQLKALSVPALASVFYVWFSKYFMNDLAMRMGESLSRIAVFTLSVLIAYLVALAFVALFKHRGFTHTLTFAAIYGGLLYLVTRSVGLPHEKSLYLAISGFTGDMIHLIADYRKKPLKAFRLW